LKNFIQRFKNAKTVIRQIKAREWRAHYNPLSRRHLTAHNGTLQLWIGNGAWFCEIDGGSGNYFGLVWRHYVWWLAAKKLTNDADKQIVEAVPKL
jgi:hypothetical protein